MASLDLNSKQIWGLVLQIILFIWILAMVSYIIKRSGDDGDFGSLRSFAWVSLFILPPIVIGAWALNVSDN